MGEGLEEGAGPYASPSYRHHLGSSRIGAIDIEARPHRHRHGERGGGAHRKGVVSRHLQGRRRLRAG
eukprot:211238-Pyramimonas_sp.AAC.1